MQKFNWKKDSIHLTFTAANAKRVSLQEAGSKHVKIRRCGYAGTQFKVVVGSPLKKSDEKSKKSKKQTKTKGEKKDETK